MKRLGLALAFCISLIGSALAQGGMGPGPGMVHSTGGGGYTGPGDVVSGATAWWGLRGYSAAYSTGSNPAIDVCDDASLLTCSTINILSNGNLDVATAAAAPACAVKCDITKWYDQTGNGHHATQSSAGRMFVLTFNCLGSLPCGVFNPSGGGQGTFYLAATAVSPAKPVTASAVWDRTSSTTAFQVVVGGTNTGAGAIYLGTANSTNTARIADDANAFTATANDNTVHASSGVFNAASSVLNIDGTETTGTLNTNASLSGQLCFTGQSGSGTCGSNPFFGNIFEGGLWPSGFSGGQRTSMNSNQHTYWGF